MDQSYFRNKEHLLPEAEPLAPLHPAVRKLLKVVLPLVVAGSLWLLYSGRLDAWVYDKDYMWLVAALILAGIPALIYHSVKLWLPAERYAALAVILCCASVLINGPVYGFWLGRHEEALFRRHGVVTDAIVTEAFYSKGRRIYYGFDAAGQYYESYNMPDPGDHREGDTIRIIYNSRIPSMNRPVAESE